MDLREYARTETAAFVDRLVGAAEALAHKARTEADREIAAVRSEIDTLRANLEAQTARSTALEADLDSVIEAHRQVDGERLKAEKNYAHEVAARAKAEEELRGARELLERARAEATRVTEALEQEAAQKALLQDDLDNLRKSVAQLEVARNSADEKMRQLDAKLAEARGTETSLRSDLAEVSQKAAALKIESETAAHAMKERFHGELRAARSEAEAISADRDAVRAEAATLRAQVDALRGETKSLRSEAETLRADADVLRADAERLRAEGSGAAGELQSMQELLDASRKHHEEQVAAIKTLEMRLQEAEAAGGATLVSAIRAFDALGGATSVNELFGALTRQLGTLMPRVALFRVKGNHLEGEHAAGIETGVDMQKLMIPMTVDSIITRAASGGTLIQADFDLLRDTLSPFGGNPASAVAIPVTFQGETLAVLYGDSDGPVTQAHTTFAVLLVRHATVLLSRLTQELKVVKELREYAALLLQEAEQMFVADVEGARPAHESIRRLRETVECGRQLYAQRAALEGAFAAGLFDEQISLIINAHASPFAEALQVATTQSAARTA